MSNFVHGTEDGKDAPSQRPMAEQQSNVDAEGAGQGGSSALESDVTTNAWTIAALAHASIVLTLLLAFAGGVGALVGLVIPLVIYLSYRECSRFITLHALQALVYQGTGILIYLVLAIVLALIVTLAWTVSGLLSVVAIGVLMMPFALLVTALMVIVLLGAPLAWVAYGLYAAYQVYQGNDLRYWLLGEWVEREVKV